MIPAYYEIYGEIGAASIAMATINTFKNAPMISILNVTHFGVQPLSHCALTLFRANSLNFCWNTFYT